MYEAVLFDLDGVLVDTDTAVAALWRETSARYGREVSDADVQAHVLGCTPEHTVAALFPRQPPEVHEVILARVRGSEPHLRHQPHHDGLRLLTALAGHRLPLALVTSASPTRVGRILGDLGAAGAFDSMVTWGEAAHGKPAPDPYLLAAQRLGVAPERCVVFEDAPAGVRAAVAAGACCVAVDRYGACDLGSHGATAVVGSLDDVTLRVGYEPVGPVVLCLPNGAPELFLRRPAAWDSEPKESR